MIGYVDEKRCSLGRAYSTTVNVLVTYVSLAVGYLCYCASGGRFEGGQLAELCNSSFYSLSSPSQTTLTRRGGKWYWKQYSDFFATVKKFPNVNMVT